MAEEKWWPTLEEYNPNISEEKWLELLNNEEIFNYKSMCMMRRFVDYGGAATCADLSSKYGGTVTSYIGIEQDLGKRIQKALNLKLCKDSDGREYLFTIPFLGRHVNKTVDENDGDYIWKLRPELETVLSKIDLSKYELYSLEFGSKINELLEFYEKSFSEHWEDEKYKWEAVKRFRENWDIKAPNFKEMFNKATTDSTGKVWNLLVSVNHYPQGMILNFAEKEPEATRKMFKVLYDETKDLDERVDYFKSESDRIRAKYDAELKSADPTSKGWGMHFQDDNSISTYLWLRYPDKYYIYKYTEYKTVAEELNFPLKFTKGHKENLKKGFKMYEKLTEVLKENDAIKNLFQSSLTPECYNDPELHTLTLDFGFQVSRYLKKYWAVGFSWESSGDQTDRFFRDGIWEEGFLSHGDTRYKSLVNKISIGDILVLKSSATKGEGHSISFTKVKAIGEVMERVNDSTFSVDWKTSEELPKDFDGISYRKTIEKVRDDDLLKYVKTFLGITINGEKKMNNPFIEETELLEEKKNVILQGAPGTGKTYTTAGLALSIIGEADVDYNKHDEVMEKYQSYIDNGQIGFITFHQSMDYEDFVEGLKPEDVDGEVRYRLEKGIFRLISERAKKNYEDSHKTEGELQKEGKINEMMNVFLTEAFETQKQFKTANGNIFTIGKYDGDNLYVSIPSNEKVKELKVPLEEIEELLTNDVQLNLVQDVRDYFKRKWRTQYDSYVFKLALEIKNSSSGITEQKAEKVVQKNYVLIIDEINRGNVSKIFGELISLLEADKRLDAEHPITVMLPYSKDKFSVPQNLYIIGTMNTTDRSVGNIDYAVRRRFSFITLKSRSDIVESKSIPIASELFDAVRNYIQQNRIEMDIEDLMVGHSYFIAKDEKQLERKWKYDILPLLSEYYKDGIIPEPIEDKEISFKDFIEKYKSEESE